MAQHGQLRRPWGSDSVDKVQNVHPLFHPYGPFVRASSLAATRKTSILTHVIHPEIKRAIDAQLLRWPSEKERDSEEPYFAGNRRFIDLGDLTWNDAVEALARDRVLAEALRQGTRSEDEIADDAAEDIENPLLELDVGVAGAVAAIAALGAFPAASCNGGAFGGSHSYQHPLVAFYCQPDHLPPIMASAERTGVGITNSPIEDGSALLYSSDIDDLMAFAADLIRTEETGHFQNRLAKPLI